MKLEHEVLSLAQVGSYLILRLTKGHMTYFVLPPLAHSALTINAPRYNVMMSICYTVAPQGKRSISHAWRSIFLCALERSRNGVGFLVFPKWAEILLSGTRKRITISLLRENLTSLNRMSETLLDPGLWTLFSSS